MNSGKCWCHMRVPKPRNSYNAGLINSTTLVLAIHLYCTTHNRYCPILIVGQRISVLDLLSLLDDEFAGFLVADHSYRKMLLCNHFKM